MVHILPAPCRLCARSSFELARGHGNTERSINCTDKALTFYNIIFYIFNKCDDKSLVFDSANPIPAVRPSGRKDSDYI